MTETMYLTPDDFKIAEANGIGYTIAYSRFYKYGWTKEQSITRPVKKRKDNLWYEYKEIAENHNVTYFRFYDRVHKSGWDPMEAATTVPVNGGHKGRIVLTPEILERAEKNGIKKATLKHRMYVYKWSLERASTEPIDTSKRRKDYEANRA